MANSLWCTQELKGFFLLALLDFIFGTSGRNIARYEFQGYSSNEIVLTFAFAFGYHYPKGFSLPISFVFISIPLLYFCSIICFPLDIINTVHENDLFGSITNTNLGNMLPLLNNVIH